MLGYELEPVDGGSCIPLPQGETLLGRGPLLGVTDKRVSRHHGLLENSGGQLRIKPTHLNPCFCLSSLEDPPRPLEKDRWHPLHPGDLFSLLPGRYIYRVVSTEQDGTRRNSQFFEDGDSPKDRQEQKVPSDPVVPCTLEQHTQPAPANIRQEDDRTLSLKQTSTMDSESERPKVEERKRVLPAWMMQATADVQSPDTPKGVKRGRGKATSSQPKNPICTSTRGRAISSGDESDQSETEETLRKGTKRKRSNKEDDAHQKAAVSSVVKARRPARPIRGETSEESDGDDRELSTGNEDAGRKGGHASKANPEQRQDTPDGEEKDRPRETGGGARRKKEGPAQATAPRREPCPYGKDCYRKNPNHFKECSHPGDSDYVEASDEVEDEDDDRPECPYGTSCYRKNPQHKKEYKHTKAPGEKVSAKQEYADLDDDSLVDDESESIDEDSDYVPSESEDSVNMKKQKKALLRK